MSCYATLKRLSKKADRTGKPGDRRHESELLCNTQRIRSKNVDPTGKPEDRKHVSELLCYTQKERQRVGKKRHSNPTKARPDIAASVRS